MRFISRGGGALEQYSCYSKHLTFLRFIVKMFEQIFKKIQICIQSLQHIDYLLHIC